MNYIRLWVARNGEEEPLEGENAERPMSKKSIDVQSGGASSIPWGP
jgi:hypothetical protein